MLHPSMRCTSRRQLIANSRASGEYFVALRFSRMNVLKAARSSWGWVSGGNGVRTLLRLPDEPAATLRRGGPRARALGRETGAELDPLFSDVRQRPNRQVPDLP